MPSTPFLPIRVSSSTSRPGFSLTELLVAMTIGLIVLSAVASLFVMFGSAARTIEANTSLAERLRATSARLRQDLAGVTVSLTLPNEPNSGTGYFEYIEGVRRDFNPGTAEADTDDVLLFTARAGRRPFTGRFSSVTAAGTTDVGSFESPYAEIAWFCKPAPAAEQTVAGLRLHRLYRRQLLAVAYVGQVPFMSAGAANRLNDMTLAPNLQTAYLNFDLSLRNVGSASAPVWAPNSLADLTRREFRFLHNSGTSNIQQGFPHAFVGISDPAATFDGSIREGEDVVLGNVIGFDVRAFDPEAGRQIHTATGTRMQPGDPGFVATVASVLPSGAYVDLNWGATAPDGLIAGLQGPGRNTTLTTPTYDSWSRHYGFGGVQAPSPYGIPLRGIEIRIRCYEQTSKQVRQISVRHTFVRQ